MLNETYVKFPAIYMLVTSLSAEGNNAGVETDKSSLYTK